jgi:predicted RND superfamily exporter protein
MVYEMKAGFSSQMLLLILLTAASIFLVVLLSFRRIAVPLILVLLVQCGVYITIAASGLMGYSIYFQAMLVVQCILMGATIDYGILFTNYYREARTAMRREASLTAAYEGSIHTVLTSGLIMILVTGVIGMSGADPTVCQICQTISIGALSAVLLILFVLPGLLATFDRFVCSKNAI